MTLSIRSGHATWVALVVLGIAAADPVAGATVPFLPVFDPANFAPGTPVTNPYFPLPAGRRAVFTTTDGEGNPLTEHGMTTVTSRKTMIGGIAATTVIDVNYDGSKLTERTVDYFGQDRAGNVWYLGEDVHNFTYDDAGNLIGTNTQGSWRTGVNGALPGFAMPATPKIGDYFFQEFAPKDEALDQGLVVGLLDSLTVAAGTFRNVLTVFESSSIDPALRELKYYAPGIGLIRADEGVDANYGNPVAIEQLASIAPVPLPAGLPMLAGALGLTALLVRRRSKP